MIVLVFLSTIVATNGFECKQNLTTTRGGTVLSAQYNLCEMQIDASSDLGYYIIKDQRSYSNYTYYFNIANNVQRTIPDSECYNLTLRDIKGLPLGFCPDESIKGSDCNNDLVAINKNVAVYQIFQYENTCYRLHDGDTEPKWSFHNENDPSFGVSLTYLNGDFCPPGGINRKFTINFLCTNDMNNIPDRNSNIFETGICEYAVTIPTEKGCPTECEIVEGLLCSGHGICDYDFNRGRSKCFCYCGYSGKGCDQVINDNIACSIPPISNNTDCKGTNASHGCVFSLADTMGVCAEYDLEWFNLHDSVFEVPDQYLPYLVYKFNICDSISSAIYNMTIPDSCITYSRQPCITYNVTGDYTICVQFADITGKVPSAVQIDTNSLYCAWLGMELPTSYNMPAYSVELYDKDKTGKGVIYTIKNGAWCDSAPMNRELRVTLICPDDNRIEFAPKYHGNQSIYHLVIESPICVYHLVIESPLACPTQCISKMNLEMFSVCSTHGICASDPIIGSVRCFCYDGYIGTLCEQNEADISTTTSSSTGSSSTGSSPTGSSSTGSSSTGSSSTGNDSTMMTVVVVIILIIVIFIGIFIGYKYYVQKKLKYKKDSNIYHMHVPDNADNTDNVDNNDKPQQMKYKDVDPSAPILEMNEDTDMKQEIDTNGEIAEYKAIVPSAPQHIAANNDIETNDDDNNNPLIMMSDVGVEGEGQIDNKYKPIKEWLYNSLDHDMDDVAHYLPLFIENGFDSLNILKNISNNDLIHIGITKLGHRKKILHSAKAL